jgi:hypothetical protein
MTWLQPASNFLILGTKLRTSRLPTNDAQAFMRPLLIGRLLTLLDSDENRD